jgi:hypothetical protein
MFPSGDCSVFIVCVPYYSLPEFPSDCLIVKDHDILPRDILLCNKRNFHFKGGVQYDPYIEALEYRNCQPRIRQAIADKARKYDVIYILFRTCFLMLGRSSRYFVTGYYKVLPVFTDSCRDAPVIKASVARFVSINESVDITCVMNTTRAFRSCPTTENKEWRARLNDWLHQLEKAKDLTRRYIEEIERLKIVFGEQEFSRSSQGYLDCKNCRNENDLCPLVWRRCHRGIPPRFPPHFLPHFASSIHI